jgi:hypothetical protein
MEVFIIGLERALFGALEVIARHEQASPGAASPGASIGRAVAAGLTRAFREPWTGTIVRDDLATGPLVRRVWRSSGAAANFKV